MIKFKHIPNITTIELEFLGLIQVHPSSHPSMDGVVKFREGVSKASRVTTEDILCIYWSPYPIQLLFYFHSIRVLTMQT